MSIKNMIDRIAEEISMVLFDKNKIQALKIMVEECICIDQLSCIMTDEEVEEIYSLKELCDFLEAYFNDEKMTMRRMKLDGKINWYLSELYNFIYIYNIEEIVDEL